MRLLHVVDWGAGTGGRETYLAELRRRSASAGWSHDTVGIGDVDRAAMARSEADVVMIHTGRSWERVVAACAGRIRCVAWAHNHDWVCPGSMSWFPTTGEICTRRAGPACAVHAQVHRCAPRRPDHLLADLRATRATLAAAPRLHRVLAASRYMEGRLVDAGVPASAVVRVPLFARWDPVADPPPPPAGGRPRILTASRLHPIKGVDRLLDAMAHVATPTEVVIAGRGSDAHTADLRRRADALGGRHAVRFVGIAEGDLPDLYRSSTVVVVPSSLPEPFGLVGLEAMAFARPVVATDVGGVGDWLADSRTGLLVPAGDVAALGAAIERVVADPALARRLGEGGHHAVTTELTWERHLAGLTGALS